MQETSKNNGATTSGAAYRSELAKYHQELFDYYQRLLQVLVDIGEHLATGGLAAAIEEFPWLAGEYPCSSNHGDEIGEDGESRLAVELAGRSKHPFPAQWPLLRDAILYSTQHYGKFSNWWLVQGSSFNLHGLFIPFPFLFLSDEQFFGDEYAALQDLIHEPLHDQRMYGFGHRSQAKEIVSMVVPADSPYGDAFYQLHWFLKTAQDEQGTSLWSKILQHAGPRPQPPVRPGQEASAGDHVHKIHPGPWHRIAYRLWNRWLPVYLALHMAQAVLSILWQGFEQLPIPFPPALIWLADSIASSTGLFLAAGLGLLALAIWTRSPKLLSLSGCDLLLSAFTIWLLMPGVA